MREALSAALAGKAALVFPCDIADLSAARAAAGEQAMVLLVLASTVPNLDRATLLAAVGPLAEAFAPHARIAALDVREGAEPDAVVAAALYLASADSTTGQTLRITPR